MHSCTICGEEKSSRSDFLYRRPFLPCHNCVTSGKVDQIIISMQSVYEQKIYLSSWKRKGQRPQL